MLIQFQLKQEGLEPYKEGQEPLLGVCQAEQAFNCWQKILIEGSWWNSLGREFSKFDAMTEKAVYLFVHYIVGGNLFIVAICILPFPASSLFPI